MNDRQAEMLRELETSLTQNLIKDFRPWVRKALKVEKGRTPKMEVGSKAAGEMADILAALTPRGEPGRAITKAVMRYYCPGWDFK